MLKKIYHKAYSIYNKITNTPKNNETIAWRNIRQEFVELISKTGSVLEIGPFWSPVCVGSHVKYFDILNREDLIKRAIMIGGTSENIDKIPFIDYVSPTGDLTITKEKFNSIISSHVIEHQFDFISHLQHVSNILHEGGKYYIIAPDKRYCFDYFNNKSTIADIIHSYGTTQTRHYLKNVLEHRALTTHNDAVRHWSGDHGTIENNIERIKEAISEHNTGLYIDVHAWYFTPDSITKIIQQLIHLEYIDFHICELIPTQRNCQEFYIVLEKP